MRIIQINLNHCEAAQDLLAQRVIEEKVDIAIISEPYVVPQNCTWIADRTTTAAIWACGSLPFQQVNTQDVGFVMARIKGIFFYSCYAPPRWSLDEIQRMLESLAAHVRANSVVVVCGDFNAWAVEWGSRCTNARGRCLLETFASLPVTLMNDGNGSTFRRAGSSSVIDISFVSDSMVSRTEWKLTEDFTNSDHQAIMMTLSGRNTSSGGRVAFTGPKWKDSCFDRDTFVLMLSSYQNTGNLAEDGVRGIYGMLNTACDAAMPRRTAGCGRPPCYWWTGAIRDLRSACFVARRRAQRTRGRTTGEYERARYEDLRKQLRRAIKESKRQSFLKICQEADVNPFGTAYRVVCKNIGARKQPRLGCPVLLRRIIETLFPRGRPYTFISVEPGVSGVIPEVTRDEVLAACARVGDRKTPGPDGIPNGALKVAIRQRPDVFVDLFQKCLVEGVFPRKWKEQRLVLIPKPGKPPGEPSSYRPICLLDTMGKILERIIYGRLLTIAETRGALSNMQFGFRKGRSTVDAIRHVVDIARQAIEGERWRFGSKEYCAVVTLDIRNAFNSADWGRIMSSLFNMGTPQYLMDLVHDYFRNRRLIYSTDDGEKDYMVTAGVPQGSVLGPLLWNIMYDGVLRLPLPGNTTIVGFADDIAVVSVAKTVGDMEANVNMAVGTVGAWLEAAGLALAANKTEAVLISSRKVVERMRVVVGDASIESKRAIKYLGVMIDDRLNFKEHVGFVSKRASATQVALARMMPNIGGPKPLRRRIISSVITSIMLYACPIWSGALSEGLTRRKLSSVYRLGAIRLISGFRTISEDAALVLARTMPIDILADEMRRIYFRRLEDPQRSTVIKSEERCNSMCEWQSRWEFSLKGRWTFCLVPAIVPWIRAKHCQPNFYMTQFLSGHGCFRKYLHKFGHDESPTCPVCMEEDEDVEHVVFRCPRFERPWGSDSNPGQLFGEMMISANRWDECSSCITAVMKELRRFERQRSVSNN